MCIRGEFSGGTPAEQRQAAYGGREGKSCLEIPGPGTGRRSSTKQIPDWIFGSKAGPAQELCTLAFYRDSTPGSDPQRPTI